MSCRSVLSRLVLILGLGAASGAAAATLNETDMPGGAFSASWAAPTVVGAGITTITGTGNQNQFDNFVLTGLPSGAQSVVMTFSAPAGAGYSYAAGGSILWSTQPFRWGWDGTYATPIYAGYWMPNETVALSLGSAFSGPLYLALNFTYGQNLGYSIALGSVALPPPPPVNEVPAAVPVPGAVASLGAGLAMLGALAHRRKRRTARVSGLAAGMQNRG